MNVGCQSKNKTVNSLKTGEYEDILKCINARGKSHKEALFHTLKCFSCICKRMNMYNML